MGINNRQRRAAKARRRARHHPHPTARPPQQHQAPPPPRADTVNGLLERLHIVAASNDEGHRHAMSDRYAAIDSVVFDAVAEAEVLDRLDLLWRHGWQPAEVVRQVRRHDARAGRVAIAAVVADHAERPPATLDDRWREQVEALDAAAVARRGWLKAVAAHDLGQPRRDLVAAVIELLHVLVGLGPVLSVVPPPGDVAARHVRAAGDVDSALLGKVRALLAQAESTTFAAEADAFTAKAQDLMARHAIEETVLWATSEQPSRPVSTRIAIDDPYADVKSLLLQHVAAHGRCRAVWADRYGWSTVVGFPTDIAATELLFTSLLMQASNALRAEAAASPPGSRSRTRAFRSSFWLGFAVCIDGRLGEIASAAETTSDHDASTLVPALRARDQAVDDELASLVGPLASNPVRGGHDTSGWVRGSLAAELARLQTGDLTRGSRGLPA